MLQQIGFERSKTRNGRPAVTERPQARIDAEHEAVGRALVEQRNHCLRKAREVLLAAQGSRAVTLSVGRI